MLFPIRFRVLVAFLTKKAKFREWYFEVASLARIINLIILQLQLLYGTFVSIRKTLKTLMAVEYIHTKSGSLYRVQLVTGL